MCLFNSKAFANKQNSIESTLSGLCDMVAHSTYRLALATRSISSFFLMA